MSVFNIEKSTISNQNYRWVSKTTQTLQLVFMSLKAGEEIGMEVHENVTQFIRVESGNGLAIVNGISYELNNESAVWVPPGIYHNIINNGVVPLKLYTLYSPPEHPSDRIQQTKPS